jgi:hypothetical protein
MPTVGFEPTISAGERPQTYALDRAPGTGIHAHIHTYIHIIYIYIHICYLFIVIMSLWICCLCLRRCYSLDPFPLKSYVHIKWTRDLMRQIGWIDWNTVIIIAIDGTNAFKALMYWRKLASTMHKGKHLFSTCSMTGKSHAACWVTENVVHCVFSDGNCAAF